ncbi:Uncharacterised protein [Chromobacterium violaceum]|uniref:Uncharacterized protein n=1 Tax=Chromobacterium violaceum TaxID=536 RepID=A0A3S5DLL7_CHRVL|nr:Uncharacterised protein [Chromobacterium violaceum]
MNPSEIKVDPRPKIVSSCAALWLAACGLLALLGGGLPGYLALSVLAGGCLLIVWLLGAPRRRRHPSTSCPRPGRKY